MTSLRETEQTKNSTDREVKTALKPFPAANRDYRYLRNRTSVLCTAYNSLPIDASDADRARAWHDIVSPEKADGHPDRQTAPLIKGPIHIDYGENVHIHPSCFINRDCYIAHSPNCAVSIGENTIVGVGARFLGVTHPIDWRERQGRYGPSLAGDVKIGADCFVGASVIFLPGVTIGDGCVIGAGSMVIKSMPAYHVVAGNPARTLRKVDPNVPDGAGLAYDVEGDRVFVSMPGRSDLPVRESDPRTPCQKKRVFKMRSLEWIEAFKARAPLHLGRTRRTALRVCALVAAVTLGYWLRDRESA